MGVDPGKPVYNIFTNLSPELVFKPKNMKIAHTGDKPWLTFSTSSSILEPEKSTGEAVYNETSVDKNN